MLRRRMMTGEKEEIDYSTRYFTLKALQSGTFKHTNFPVDYSVDGGNTWTTLSAGSSTPTVQAGTKVMFRGTITPSSSYGVGTFTGTNNFVAEGNVMSLLYGDNFEGQVDLTGKNYAFYRLFYSANKLVKAKNLSLPATTLADYCYADMFYDCSSLTTAPELPATTLAGNCYNQMFRTCSKLNYIKAMFLTTPSSSYTNNWLYGVASSGTFVKNSAATWNETGVNGVPSGWTVQTASS